MNELLLQHFLDPTLSVFDIADRAGLGLDEVLDWVDSPDAHAILDNLRAVADYQAALILATVRPRAIQTLAIIAAQEPTTPAHTETIRKAAAQLARIAGAAPEIPNGPDDTYDDDPNDTNSPDDHDDTNSPDDPNSPYDDDAPDLRPPSSPPTAHHSPTPQRGGGQDLAAGEIQGEVRHRPSPTQPQSLHQAQHIGDARPAPHTPQPTTSKRSTRGHHDPQSRRRHHARAATKKYRGRPAVRRPAAGMITPAQPGLSPLPRAACTPPRPPAAHAPGSARRGCSPSHTSPNRPSCS